MVRKKIYMALATSLLLSSATNLVADDSGFLSDYGKLEPITGSHAQMYTAPDAIASLKKYKAIMIDQPEFVIASDSKYKGVKPDEAKALADAWRAQIADTVTRNGRLFVVDQPGPEVLYVRMAASNVHLAKKKRGLLGYTPAGLVVGGAVAAGQDMQQRIILQDMNLEFEFLDSQSQEVLAAIVDKVDTGKEDKPSESWSKENTVMDYWVNRFNCRLENSQKPQNEWEDCEKPLPE